MNNCKNLFFLWGIVVSLNFFMVVGGWAQPAAGGGLKKEIRTQKDNAVMVLIPEGEFIYGIKKSDRKKILQTLSAPELDIFKHEFKEQKITLPNYYIDKYEVTNQQYITFVKSTGHRMPAHSDSKVLNGAKQPVVGVGWGDAEKYCQWAGKRLPSEEEWEKAARGTDGRIWPWGNKASSKKYNGFRQGNNAPVTVGSYKAGASPYNVHDMAGNVYEMTSGTWKDDARAMRGGSFLNKAALSRTMFRWAADDEKNGATWLGFRCAGDVNLAQ